MEKSKDMPEETRVSREEVEGFVGKLKGFHGSLDESEQAMLETVLEGAQSGDTSGYAIRRRYGADSQEGWNDLVGFLTEGDETQGFSYKWG